MLKLTCAQATLDPAIFFYHQENKLCGVLACHVDDFLHAGNAQFEDNIMKPLRTRFLAGKLGETIFKYIGFNIHQTPKGIILDQQDYINSLDIPILASKRMSQKLDSLTSSENTKYRRAVGQLNWAVQGSHPDLAFDLIDLSTKFKNACINDFIKALKSIRKLKQTNTKILFPVLNNDPHNWTIILFSDAAHANLNDGVSSVGAHIIFLVDNHLNCCPLTWQSKKIKRIVRSTIASEALSLQEAIEHAIFLRSLIEEILILPSNVIPIDAVIDNKSVVEAIHSTKVVNDKRLNIDISAIKQSLQSTEIRSIRWCPGSLQLANSLTKRGAQSHLLLDTLQSGRLNLEGWIIT